MNILEKVRALVNDRQRAYQQVFDPANRATRAVLADLTRFCRGTESAFHPDPRVHAVLEGRREVLLRIQQHTNLSPDELWQLFGESKK